MAKKISFECDRCRHSQPSTQKFGSKHETPNTRWMYSIELVVHQGEPDNRSRFGAVTSSAMYCDVCALEVGILVPSERYTEGTALIGKEPPQMEDVLRNIVTDLVNETLEERGL